MNVLVTKVDADVPVSSDEVSDFKQIWACPIDFNKTPNTLKFQEKSPLSVETDRQKQRH
jgi:hypothetical protein